jgi:hypothetical protein
MAITVRIVDNSNAFMQRTMGNVRMGVEAAAEALAAAMKDTLSSRGGAGGGLGSGAGGVSPSSPGSPPAMQRGALHRSIGSTIATVKGSVVSARAGENLSRFPNRRQYGLSLDRGFTATARGGALLVPLQPEAHRLLERNMVRNNPQLFMVRRPGKPPLLARKGPRGSIVPLFVLKKSVTVKPRPWLRPSLDRARPAMAAAFIRAASVGRNAA